MRLTSKLSGNLIRTVVTCNQLPYHKISGKEVSTLRGGATWMYAERSAVNLANVDLVSIEWRDDHKPTLSFLDTPTATTPPAPGNFVYALPLDKPSPISLYSNFQNGTAIGRGRPAETLTYELPPTRLRNQQDGQPQGGPCDSQTAPRVGSSCHREDGARHLHRTKPNTITCRVWARCNVCISKRELATKKIKCFWWYLFPSPATKISFFS